MPAAVIVPIVVAAASSAGTIAAAKMQAGAANKASKLSYQSNTQALDYEAAAQKRAEQAAREQLAYDREQDTYLKSVKRDETNYDRYADWVAMQYKAGNKNPVAPTKKFVAPSNMASAAQGGSTRNEQAMAQGWNPQSINYGYSPTEAQPQNMSAAVAPQNGGMVRMKAPNGVVSLVKAADVEHYKQKGAVLA
jgi:hypothetical protein